MFPCRKVTFWLCRPGVACLKTPRIVESIFLRPVFSKEDLHEVEGRVSEAPSSKEAHMRESDGPQETLPSGSRFGLSGLSFISIF